MLDLYKDEPKKVFKIMDVIIDQEIDVNMKKPLHLWYYQEKSKQGKKVPNFYINFLAAYRYCTVYVFIFLFFVLYRVLSVC